MNDLLRNIPSVDQVLSQESSVVLLERYRREHVVELVRQALAALRRELREGTEVPKREELLERVVEALAAAVERDSAAHLRRVINATGIILHTGLGRAPLPPAALEEVQRVAENYCNLEYDLERGRRGSRLGHVEGLICAATGAEAAAVVNNNAAAVLLMLNSLAQGREVIVSRGQLVEIGGSFRMPDIIAASGARICEVGTTNRTHLRDYAEVIGAATAAILVVHPSNYKVQGFTAEVGLKELVELGKKAEIPLIYDLGGGVLMDLEALGLPPEPVVANSLATGVDLVSFSGDKVLGGPQAGIIAGCRCYLERIVNNPLMRALRCDKMILAALEATLRLYRLAPEAFTKAHPTLRMMGEEVDLLEERALGLLELLPRVVVDELRPVVEASWAQAGSGALPLAELESRAMALQPRSCSVEELARQLRLGLMPVVGRIFRERLLLDVRTVRDDEVRLLVAALGRAVGL